MGTKSFTYVGLGFIFVGIMFGFITCVDMRINKACSAENTYKTCINDLENIANSIDKCQKEITELGGKDLNIDTHYSTPTNFLDCVETRDRLMNGISFCLSNLAIYNRRKFGR